jgi:hypothetical protein
MTFCMVCQEDGHTQEVCPNQKCRTCGKLGHGTRDCPNLVVSKNLNQPNFARKNNVIQRSLRADDEDELFDQALSTNNVVNNQHSNPGANVNVYQNYQNPAPSTSRQSYSSIYTPPEFEPVKKKARNLDNEDNALFNAKNHDYLDYIDRNKDSLSSLIPLKIQSRQKSDQTNNENDQLRKKNQSTIPALPQPTSFKIKCEPSTSKTYDQKISGSTLPNENRRFDPAARNYRRSESENVSNGNSPNYSPVGPQSSSLPENRRFDPGLFFI